MAERPSSEFEYILDKLSEYDVNNLITPHQQSFYLLQSISRFYLDQDSSYYYFEKAKNNNPKLTCRILLDGERYFNLLKQTGSKDEDFSWFLEENKEINIENFRSFCQDYYTPNSSTIIEEAKDVTALSTLIRIRDKKFREVKTINWQHQNELDSLNRITIDSAYQARKSLINFTPEEIKVFSLVLHHSNDCKWNIKWTKIFIDEKAQNKIKGSLFLGPAIKRMFNHNDGICFLRDSTSTKEMEEDIRLKYPNYYSDYFN